MSSQYPYQQSQIYLRHQQLYQQSQPYQPSQSSLYNGRGPVHQQAGLNAYQFYPQTPGYQSNAPHPARPVATRSRSFNDLATYTSTPQFANSQFAPSPQFPHSPQFNASFSPGQFLPVGQFGQPFGQPFVQQLAPHMSRQPLTPSQRAPTAAELAPNCADPATAPTSTDSPTILPRYRGKHLRAASSSVGAINHNDSAAEGANSNASSGRSSSVPNTPAGSAGSSSMAASADALGTNHPINAYARGMPVHNRSVSASARFPPTLSQHRKAFNSVSSSEISIDSDSSRTQTSVSSAESIHSWEDDALRQKTPPTSLKDAVKGAIKETNREAPSSTAAAAKEHTKEKTNSATAASPTTSSAADTATIRKSPSLPKLVTQAPHLATRLSESPKQERPSATTAAKSLVLPSDLRPRFYGQAQASARDEAIKMPRSRSTGDIGLHSDVRSIASSMTGVSLSTTTERSDHPATQLDSEAGSYPVDVRTGAAGAPTLRGYRSSSGTVAPPSTPVSSPTESYNSALRGPAIRSVSSRSLSAGDARIPRSATPPLQHQRQPSGSRTATSAPASAPASSTSTASAAKTSEAAAQSVRKSRSFGARLRDMFGAKGSGSSGSDSAKDADDDAQSIRSARSFLSIRSTSSSLSRFGRRKRDSLTAASTAPSPSMMFEPSEPNTPTDLTSPNHSRNGSLSSRRTRGPGSGHGSHGSSTTKNVQRVPSLTSTPPPPAPVANAPVPTDPIMGSPRRMLEQTKLEPAFNEQLSSATSRSSHGSFTVDDDDLLPPRPPSPALRSILSNSEHEIPAEDVESTFGGALVSASPKSAGNPCYLAASNLSAGDIFPSTLSADNIESIVSSVERTGSFKRQPSTKKRTEDEVVPGATEVSETSSEAEHPLPALHHKPLVSAMKRGATRRKRSGASSTGRVHFASQILVYNTYSGETYDRTPDLMTCDQLKEPGASQRLCEELNHWKTLMPIHPDSVKNLHFYRV